MKQLVITPNCPRCGGALWFMPCPYPAGCSDAHFECPACGVAWARREGEWLRFDAAGRIVEILPPRLPRFRRPRPS